MNWRLSVQAGFTTLLLALLALLAACGSVSSKAKATATPVPPTATPPPKGWNAVTSPPFGSEGNLTAVAALSASDAWAVGGQPPQGCGDTEPALIQHWDGHAWTAAQAAGPGLNQNALAGVCAISATEAWAVGYYSHAYGSQQSLIMRYIA